MTLTAVECQGLIAGQAGKGNQDFLARLGLCAGNGNEPGALALGQLRKLFKGKHQQASQAADRGEKIRALAQRHGRQHPAVAGQVEHRFAHPLPGLQILQGRDEPVAGV